MLHVLSLKSRVTIINNLVVPTIWHKVIALQPPRDLVANIQKVLINFFWGGHHWLKPDVLCRPRHEGGQSVAHIQSRIMTFRLMTIKRLLYSEFAPWHPLTNALLR